MNERKIRLTRARWQRLTRWEFWPIAAVYPPVIFSWLYHALRLRGPTLWAGCNPGMEASGMALEEKGKILDSFQGPDGAVKLAPYLRISQKEPDQFKRLKEHFPTYPLVLKPDFGQRGQGVKVIHSDEEANRWLDQCNDDIVAQEFVEGLEFGVHWLRFPNQPKGEIRSICGKHPQSVVGDGLRSLSDLIVDDDRAILSASYYFRKYRDQLEKIIPEGESFQLAPIGTHSRGAVFTDERHLVTEKLVEAFDELGARFPGFHFGRYDVKVPSLEDFQAGRNIQVLELNGVMGEPAHIYQPGYPWRRGIRDLISHFKTAAEIGAAHRELGVAPPEAGDILDLILRHREKSYLEIDEKR